MTEIAIKIEGGVIKQQDVTILKGVNLEIGKGELVYFIGKVGSG